ncbi:MAG: adenylate cyclase, partial [Planctomycetota bacterium]
MSESEFVEFPLAKIADLLGQGIAVIDLTVKSSKYANLQIRKWFPSESKSTFVDVLFADADRQRLLKRVAKGRAFQFESSFQDGPRTRTLSLTVRQIEVDASAWLLVEAVDISKNKELEYMLDSFSKLSDRHASALQRANNRM